MDKLLTVKSTAKEFNLPEEMLRNWIKQGKCPGIYHGNRFLINISMLEDMIHTESVQSMRP